jgi:uncharacterized protein (TIGR03435 family)
MRFFFTGLLLTGAMCGQTFEAASVKPAAGAGRPSMRGGPDTPDPGRIAYTNVTLTNAILKAWDLKPWQAAGPAWLSTDRFDIAATIPVGAAADDFRAMLRRLLTDRFHLVTHHEARQLQGYELALGKGAPMLKPSSENGPDVQPTEMPKSDANGFPVLTAPGLVMMEGLQGKAVVSFLTARAQPVSALVETLSREFRLPVLDRTGLAGKFDFTLEFAPQAPGALPPEGAEDSAANLIRAVPQQLGLRLEPKKIAVDVLVVDKADRALAEN